MEREKQKRNHLCSFLNFLERDVSNENETKTVGLILRVFSLGMCIYFLFTIMSFFVAKTGAVFVLALPCFLIFLFCFYLTYQNKTGLVSTIATSVMFIWIIYCVYCFGLDSASQHFLFVLVVMYMFTSINPLQGKLIYAVFLCGCRLAIYLYTQTHQPQIYLSGNLKNYLQSINTIAIFAILTWISYLYTKDSQAMERKLVIYNEKLEMLAAKDPLTGLNNRRSMMTYLEKKGDDYLKGAMPNLSIAVGDIDFFKKVNDNYGHDFGDAVLKQLAHLLEEFMKDKGCVARWGGEEFLIAFENLNGDEAYIRICELMNLIRKMKVIHCEKELSITMTFGLVEFDTNGLEKTIKEADDKLYMGKESGRNTIVY